MTGNVNPTAWSAEVRVSGEPILGVGWRYSSLVYAKSLSPDQIAIVRKAAHALLSFIGDRNERAETAEKTLQAVEAWRSKYTPLCAEACWQMDNCIINAPELVETVMNIAGYHKDGDRE